MQGTFLIRKVCDCPCTYVAFRLSTRRCPVKVSCRPTTWPSGLKLEGQGAQAKVAAMITDGILATHEACLAIFFTTYYQSIIRSFDIAPGWATTPSDHMQVAAHDMPPLCRTKTQRTSSRPSSRPAARLLPTCHRMSAEDHWQETQMTDILAYCRMSAEARRLHIHS
jgi:hypothetical protein